MGSYGWSLSSEVRLSRKAAQELALAPILLHCAHYRIRLVRLAIIANDRSISFDIAEIQGADVLRGAEVTAHPRADSHNKGLCRISSSKYFMLPSGRSKQMP